MRPSVAEAATPPRAPINQMPIRGEAMVRGRGRSGTRHTERCVRGEGQSRALGTEHRGSYDCPTGRVRASSYAFGRRQMLELRCDVCQREMQEPRALVFSPPTTDAWIVEKYHVCTNCWPTIRGLLKDEEEDFNVSH